MPSNSGRLFPFAAAALLCWGALAFGSEYSWAYAPLLVFAVVTAALGLLASSGAQHPAHSLGVAMLAIVAAVLLQLAPLPHRTIESVSRASIAGNYAQLTAKATMQPEAPAAPVPDAAARSVSIAPGRTVLGLVFLVTLMALLVGCVAGVSAHGARGIAAAVVGLGALMALLELAQKASGSDVVYGFWYPPQLKGYASAPFVNRNHTAGWLLMALSLSAGYFAGGLATGLRRVTRTWRHRILWLSSRDAATTLLSGAVVVTMAIAIVFTASRSGFAGLLTALLLFGVWVLRRQPSRRRRAAAIAYLLFVLVGAASWGRADAVLARYELVGRDVRPAIWRDTLRIIQDSPLTGTGLNTYGIAMLHYQTVQDGSQYIETHNDYLQMAAEGGLLLSVPILIAIGFFVREVWRRFHEDADDVMTYWIRAGAVVGLCAIALQETVEFTLQMPGAAVLFVVLAAIAIHRPDHLHRQRDVPAPS